MKQNRLTGFMIITFCVLLLAVTSCNQMAQSETDTVEGFFQENPVTVNWRGSNTDAIESYAAETKKNVEDMIRAVRNPK